jgi:hypothetical protein
MEWAWAWATLGLLGLLVVLEWSGQKDIQWRRVGAAAVWVVRHDLGGALTVVAIGVAVGAAFVAKGLVAIVDRTAYYGGVAIMALFLLLAVVIVVVAIVGRYREMTFRNRLTTIASTGRVQWSSIIDTAGLLPAARAEVDRWSARARVLLDEIDDSGVYTQRFDIAAGLPTEDYRLRVEVGGLAPGTEGGDAARDLSFRLMRLGEIMQESPR